MVLTGLASLPVVGCGHWTWAHALTLDLESGLVSRSPGHRDATPVGECVVLGHPSEDIWYPGLASLGCKLQHPGLVWRQWDPQGTHLVVGCGASFLPT